jgi:hypothetical protein
MNILASIDKCLNTLTKDIVLGDTVFIELDKSNFEQLEGEIKDLLGNHITLLEEKVSDFGRCKILAFAQGYKVIIAINKSKGMAETFYVAFKMKTI